MFTRLTLCSLFAFSLAASSCSAQCWQDLGYQNACWPSSQPPPQDENCSGMCDAQKACDPGFSLNHMNNSAEWDETSSATSGYDLTNTETIICWIKRKCECEFGSAGDACSPANTVHSQDKNYKRTLDMMSNCGNQGGGYPE